MELESRKKKQDEALEAESDHESGRMVFDEMTNGEISKFAFRRKRTLQWYLTIKLTPLGPQPL